MFLLLLNWLSCLGWNIPNFFFVLSTRMILAALSALCLTILFGPISIKKLYELKTGTHVLRVEDCPMLAQLHEKKKQTPTMGGIFILLSILICLVFWMNLTNTFTLLFIFSIFWLGGIGAYDDYLKLKYKNSKGFSAKKRLLLQIVFAAIIACYAFVPGLAEKTQRGNFFEAPSAKISTQKLALKDRETFSTTSEYMSYYYIPFFKRPLLRLSGKFTIVAILLTVFVIVGSSNAVNLTDGLDGLAAGCVILVASVFALVAFLSSQWDISRYFNLLYIKDASEIAVFLAIVVGSCLGFLWFNGYPAQIFMGDTGSLPLGGFLGVSAVFLRKEFLLALVGGIFVMEALSVILQVSSYKMRNKKRIFLCSPLHHHFEYKGWPETKVTIRFWIVGLLLAIIGIISLKTS